MTGLTGWLVGVACLCVVEAYIQLQDVSYVRLPNDMGQLAINASTRNRLAFDDATNFVYAIAKEPRTLTVFTLGPGGALTEFQSYDLTSQIRGDPMDVEFCRPASPTSTPRLVISYNDAFSEGNFGTAVIYGAITALQPDLNELFTITTGAQPVDMEFAQNCLRLAIVCRGRPSTAGQNIEDKEGDVILATLPDVLSSSSSAVLTDIVLSNGITDLSDLRSRGFRAYPVRDGNGNLLDIAKNLEPTSVTFAPNGQIFYVALPKNNAIARVTSEPVSVNIIPLGYRDWSNFYMDASESDNAVRVENYRVKSFLQPVEVKWIVQQEAQWLITLDTGFIDEIPEYNYQEWDTGKNLQDSGSFAGLDASLTEKFSNLSRLGEVYVSTVDGLLGSQITEPYLFGGRGISIHDANTNNLDIRTSLVDNLERSAAQFYNNVFNTAYTANGRTPQQDRDATSPSLGPNIATMDSGFFDGNKVIFLGSGTSGMIYTYVLVPDADCPQPYFHSVYRRGGTTSTWNQLYNADNVGDLGITEMLYIGNSIDIVPTLLVASSTSNSISSYRVTDQAVELNRR